MRIEYDELANAAYISLETIESPRTAQVLDVGPGMVIIHSTESGALHGIEIVMARELLPANLLNSAEPPGGS